MKLLRALRDDSGATLVEIAVVAPVVLIALVIMMNLMMFVSECARFDRVAGEVARAATLSSGSEETAKEQAQKTIDAAMGYPKTNGRFKIETEVNDKLPVLVRYSEVRFTLKFKPWPAPEFSAFGLTVPTELSHSQGFIIDRYQTAIIFG